eukprot:CAMPEP_0174259606 /NCGR_PEP_ID=MMETSP0439-20130205/8417_1 /TAXON_ID=0 /ORGANISM="Stereomyxa ramosa, Strain Chinc5" /LENGTH=334 /DNA_ID=CAMNT_0015343569 /DNA_START=133 /DNA_END=1137 /DNA_ORIENTATION=+
MDKEVGQILGDIRDEKEKGDLADFAAGVSTLPKCNMKVRRTLRGHAENVYSLHWREDKNMIVSASRDGNLIVWEAFSTSKIHFIPLRSPWVMTCAYAPRGGFVACGGLDKTCSVYNLRSRAIPLQVVRELRAHEGYISCCRFFGDRYIITTSGDCLCIKWDVEQGSVVREFDSHSADVMCLSVCSDNDKTFITGGCDATARLWDVRSPVCCRTFSGHLNDVNAIQFLPTYPNCFVTGSDDGTLRLWDIRAKVDLMEFNAGGMGASSITSAAISRSGRYIFAGYDDCNCIVWDSMKGNKAADLDGHSSRVSCLGVSGDGGALCTGSWDTFLKIWA